MVNVALYLDSNKKIYDSDQKKITFTLLFITDGTADQFKETFIKEISAKRIGNGEPGLIS